MTVADDPTQGREDDRPALDVSCLNPKCRRAALVSTTGNHCQVWRGTRKHEDARDGESYTEFVIKYPIDRYSDADTRILASQYQELRAKLGDMVPEALFVFSCIDDEPNLFIVARAVNVWFNIANPQNREEAVGLLREYPLARAQLVQFVLQAARWREGPNPRVIDLYGLDNLVMDNQRQIRFVDSFYVFFFEDMLHLLGGEPDYDLQEKIEVSLQRLAYLEQILALSEAD
ncbi:MAG: hypothetical protein OQK74_11300 [Gammaproteobacteria bacterium]|nr:hypothetical protein [Gammaproteobacteria bacterium]